MSGRFRSFGEAAHRIQGTILDEVGDTPLVELTKWGRHHGLGSDVRLFAKLEGFNPGGSVKDRPALAMVLDGLSRGLLGEERVLLDSTSGNTGIAYALIGAVLGFRVKLCVPANASRERLATLRAFGAELVLTDPMEGSDGAILRSQELLEAEPERYWKPDQYNNPLNPEAHARTTAPEIWEQSGGAVTHVVAALGTSGTAMGLRQGFDRIAPAVEVWGVEPAGPFHGLEGLKHMASSIVPGIYDEARLTGKLPVETEEAYQLVQELAPAVGLFLGPSGGAALAGALALGRGLREGYLVAVVPDFGSRYLSTHVWRHLEHKGERP